MKKLYSLLLIFITLSVTPVFATTGHYKAHSNMKKNPATLEFEKAMEKMHKPMMAGVMNADTDVAFVKGMIPHHQGAIDMAEVELRYGKDPELRALAEKIIAAQKEEIQLMNKWLELHQQKKQSK